MYGVVLALHLIVCLALVAVILVQSGQGGGLAGGAFGGATQTVFGGRGATDFITKATVWLGVTFFVTSLVLAKMTTGTVSSGAKRSLIQQQARKAAQSAPAAVPSSPGATPVPGAAPSGGAPAPSPAGGSR